MQVWGKRQHGVVEQHAAAQIAATVVADEAQLGDGLGEVLYRLARRGARDVDLARAGGADAGGLRDDLR